MITISSSLSEILQPPSSAPPKPPPLSIHTYCSGFCPKSKQKCFNCVLSSSKWPTDVCNTPSKINEMPANGALASSKPIRTRRVAMHQHRRRYAKRQLGTRIATMMMMKSGILLELFHSTNSEFVEYKNKKPTSEPGSRDRYMVQTSACKCEGTAFQLALSFSPLMPNQTKPTGYIGMCRRNLVFSSSSSIRLLNKFHGAESNKPELQSPGSSNRLTVD